MRYHPFMPTQNRWQLGVMYGGGLLDGQPFYTQPGGPSTEVFPTQRNAEPWPEYPIPGLVIQEYSPWWSPGCGHSIKSWSIVKEFDYDNDISCALICCRVCLYVQRVVEPYEEILNPQVYAIIL